MESCPVDVLLAIVAHLPVRDILVLRRTCKTFHTVTHLRTLWTLVFRTHVLAHRIPVPSIPDDLSARDLEHLIHRALARRRIWTSPRPVPHRQLEFAMPADHASRVIFLQFLPGRSNRWLVSVRMTARPRTYLLQCWDIQPSAPRCVAELRHADGPYGGVVLNSDSSSPAVLAMQSAQTETFTINFDAHDPESAFVTEATIDGIRELYLLAGSTLVTRSMDDGGVLSIWDIADLAHEKLQLVNPSLQPDDRVHAIHVAHDYALVVHVQSIEIYTTVPVPNLLSPHRTPIAYPLTQFKFQWRTDTVILCAQHTPGSSESTSLPPIHLLVRFGSIYPWPVNVLHHYRLLPNPAWTRATTSDCNLPYDPRPSGTHTIGSPVRLFGQSAMALGPYGTALWLDSHTEEWLGPSERGQRLAGKVVALTEDYDVDEDQQSTLDASDITATTGRSAMQFGVREDDTWTRIAMDEEVGRIALGHLDGAITLLEY